MLALIIPVPVSCETKIMSLEKGQNSWIPPEKMSPIKECESKATK
jgi:hypothetical protein